jgi:hypothetical protein
MQLSREGELQFFPAGADGFSALAAAKDGGQICRWETSRPGGCEWSGVTDACWRAQALEPPVASLHLARVLFVTIRSDVAPRPPPLLLPTPPASEHGLPAPTAGQEPRHRRR